MTGDKKKRNFLDIKEEISPEVKMSSSNYILVDMNFLKSRKSDQMPNVLRKRKFGIRKRC